MVIRWVGMKRSRTFKPGELVRHARFGQGIVLTEWGDFTAIDELGNKLEVTGCGVFEVQFARQRRSVNGCWLQSGITGRSQKEPGAAAAPIWQLTGCSERNPFL
jgi:hypothetical protein